MAVTSSERLARTGLVFQFPERHFLAGTLQQVTSLALVCCSLTPQVEVLGVHQEPFIRIPLLAHVLWHAGAEAGGLLA